MRHKFPVISSNAFNKEEGPGYWVVFPQCDRCISQLDVVQVLNLFFDVNKHKLTKEHLMMIDSAIICREVTITNIKGFSDSTGNSEL
jgi:hypothetical protein